MTEKAAAKTSARVALHLGSSFPAAWENVILPWFESVAITAIANEEPVAVVTPFSSNATFLRAKLLQHRVSLLGIRFVTPAQLRELLLGDGERRLPLREHLRLLLSITAEACAKSDDVDLAAIARSVSRAPDHLLRAIDQLSAAGWTFADAGPPVLRQIVKRFQMLVRECGFQMVHEADRTAVEAAVSSRPRFSNLLVVGFNSAHWPLWPLLRAAVLSAQNSTVIVGEPREEAAELDRIWISTWEEHFDPAQQVTSRGAEPEPRFETLLLLPEAASDIAARKKEPLPHVHFILGRDSSEQARSIVALAIGFLNEPSCERLAILVPGPGALARLVASWLERLRIPHNDGIAHQMRGAFDDEEWRAWIELQEEPRLGPLLRFLNHSPTAVALFTPLSLRKIQDTLQRACGDILINAVDVLREYCCQRTDDPKYPAVANGLRAVGFLPERATFGAFVKEAASIFRALKWSERGAELDRLTRGWSEGFADSFPREYFLRWLSEIFAESSLSRDGHGDHPYARVQILRYDQAEGEIWSHVIFAGLNEGVWPPRDDESPFLPDHKIAELNERNKEQSTRFGEGQEPIREGATLCLGSRERHALAVRQLLNVIESTTHEIGIAAELYTQSPREQAVNPSEFFARLFFSARGEPLSQYQIARLHKQTHEWLTQQKFLAPDDAKTATARQTAEGYNARRTNAPFGEYEFAFRAGSPPAKQISLSATDIGNSLKRPALVWMKVFLGVQVEELSGGSWNLATGQWVHRWLAVIGAEPHERGFVQRVSADQILRRVMAAADTFKSDISSILEACGRNPEPDWWTSGWRNARHLAKRFATQLAATEDWPRLATERVLDSPHIIRLDGGEELRVRGRVDLILARDKPTPEWWIIDYKTGIAQPLKSNAAQLRKQLAGGEGIQICVYAMALRQDQQQIGASLLTRDSGLGEAVPLDFIVKQTQIWKEIARMQSTGVFGMLGELRSEFTFTGIYPLATLAIDKDLLNYKWARTHEAFAKGRDQ